MSKNHTTPTKIKRLRNHGFRERMKTRGGRMVLKRRRDKGRHQIAKTVHSKG